MRGRDHRIRTTDPAALSPPVDFFESKFCYIDAPGLLMRENYTGAIGRPHRVIRKIFAQGF
jgi:hypothetical protein